jgi:ABC-type nitrate/sulfonate/bicarbonate transport system permease component
MRPLAELLRGVPGAAIVPFTIFLIGFGLKLYIFGIVLACVWPVYYNAMAGLSSVDEVLLNTGRAFGCRRTELMFQVVLPNALPQIFIGIRIATAVSLILSVVTDMLAGQNGLGFLIFQRAFALRVGDVFALTLLCGINGMLFNQVAILARVGVIGWHERRALEAEG